MLSLCADDDELGTVLSHEIAHCLLSHAAEKLSYVNMINLALLIPLAVLWSLLPNDGIAVVADWFCRQVIDVALELPFSRKMETEADEVGLLLASKGCFDVRAAPNFWRKMAHMDQERMKAQLLELTEDVDEKNKLAEMERLPPVPAIISTHPPHEVREKNLTDLLPNALKIRSDCGCYKLPQQRKY